MRLLRLLIALPGAILDGIYVFIITFLESLIGDDTNDRT